jgi:hypothetical protein
MRRTLQIHTSYRTARVYPEPSSPRRAPGRKDTRHWCRGKVGVSHQPAQRQGAKYYFAQRESWIFAWVTCGKQFDWCMGSPVRPCTCGHHV